MNGDDDGDFELVPSSPIKRLEKRLNKLEKIDSSSDIKKLTDHILDLISSNQMIVETTIKSNEGLRKEISKLPEKIDEMLLEMRKSSGRFEKISEKTEKLKTPDMDNIPDEDALGTFLSHMKELIEYNKKHLSISQESLEHLDQINKRLKRIYLHNAVISRKVDVDLK